MLQYILFQEDLVWHGAPIALYSINSTENVIVAVEILFLVASLHNLVAWSRLLPTSALLQIWYNISSYIPSNIFIWVSVAVSLNLIVLTDCSILLGVDNIASLSVSWGCMNILLDDSFTAEFFKWWRHQSQPPWWFFDKAWSQLSIEDLFVKIGPLFAGSFRFSVLARSHIVYGTRCTIVIGPEMYQALLRTFS